LLCQAVEKLFSRSVTGKQQVGVDVVLMQIGRKRYEFGRKADAMRRCEEQGAKSVSVQRDRLLGFDIPLATIERGKRQRNQLEF
jgi:hypothetical protein